MPHRILKVNPFDVVLRLHQDGIPLNSDFTFWLRTFSHPPIRTIEALIAHCPRVDWLFWFLERLAHFDLVPKELVLRAGMSVDHHLTLIKRGDSYKHMRGVEMPHTEGLVVLRTILHEELYD
jgi:hypothetical protein